MATLPVRGGGDEQKEKNKKKLFWGEGRGGSKEDWPCSFWP